MELEDDSGYFELLDRTPGRQIHCLGQQSVIRPRILGEGLEHHRLILLGGSRDLVRNLRRGDRCLRSIRRLSEKARLHIDGSDSDVVTIDRAREHDTVAVHYVPTSRVGRGRNRPFAERVRVELVGAHELDIDEANGEDADHHEDDDDRKGEPAAATALVGHWRLLLCS